MINGVVISGKGVDTDRAKRIAERFETELLQSPPKDKNAAYFLFDKTGISFINEGQEIKCDLSANLTRVTGGHLQHEILLKVAKQEAEEEKELRAVDCTAGFGTDSFILAAGGYRVDLFEHNPITATLLKDAIIRARRNAATKETAMRMNLLEGDSKELLASLSYIPDLIYLDPMYPEKKKSAESKKKLQMLHKIESPCSDEDELVKAAIALKPKKIIIKRPPEGPYLAGITPNYSVERKAVRFDCLVF
ncbi:MAG: class I SAM-dependent methyltransferase [Lachnospiraceae bacterium]|nr:class I SAM-dependent methyltransferase [Lachnospiraceae bacterium]